MKNKELSNKELLASIAEQLQEAEALAARGEKPYVPEFLFTSGVFKSREEYD